MKTMVEGEEMVLVGTGFSFHYSAVVSLSVELITLVPPLILSPGLVGTCRRWCQSARRHCLSSLNVSSVACFRAVCQWIETERIRRAI